jgi:TonB family protein
MPAKILAHQAWKCKNMKICPACSTNYTDDSLRFCMKDGSPLVSLTDTPEIEDEPTIVAPPPPAQTQIVAPPPTAQNRDQFTISTDQPSQQQTPPISPAQAPRAQQTPTTRAKKRGSNAALFVVLGLLSVVALLGAGALGAYLIFFNNRSEQALANTNLNANAVNQTVQNANSESLLPNVNASDNLNANFDANLNLNANQRTPTPTPTRTPSPTPTTNRNVNANSTIAPGLSPTPQRLTTPAPTPIIAPTPPPPSLPQRGGTISGGVVNGKATNLPKPAYPPIARTARASGAVNVQVLIDEDGRVVSANAVSGHPLLRAAAEQAARQARFQPTMLSGQPVKVSGTIVYNFNLQ